MTSRLDRVLVVALALVLIATVTTILLSTQATTERATIRQMEQVMSRVAFEASDEARVFLDPAESMTRLTADLLEDGVFSEDDPERLEEFLIDVLRENNFMAGMFAGRPDGDFFYVKRDDEFAAAGFRTKVIEVEGDTRVVTYVWRDADGEVVRTDEDPEDVYDPRTRPWYTTSQAVDGVIWTDPYIFFTSRQPGITSAVAILDEDTGRFDGSFGVDVEIRQLSEILTTLPISDEGQAFIVDASGQLVGLSGASDLGLEDGNTLRRLTPEEVEDPIVDAAYSTLLQNGGPLVSEATFVSFEGGDRPWRASFEPFAAGRWPWTIAVFAPEDDFLEEVRETQRANTRLAIVIGVIALAVAIALATGLTRPLARMRRTVLTDQLTGLRNRRALDQLGAGLIGRSARSGTAIGVVVLDLDYFKKVNDTYGHGVGDEVLKAVSGRLTRALRDEDLLVRQGGEEFVAVLPDTLPDEAVTIGERLVAGIRGGPINTSAGPIPMTVSAGLATGWPNPDDHLRDLVAQADEALYRAKSAGRNQLVVVQLGRRADDEPAGQPAT